MQKSILITGCSSGIGYCAAKALQVRGYQVIAAVRKEEDKARLVAEGLESILLDVNDSQSIALGVEETLSKTNGQLYALFNNAGYGQLGAVEDVRRENFRQQFDTNVFGLQELTNAILPVMRKQGYGRIINVSSVLGIVAMPYRGVYCASKFAVEGLTDALRLELYNTPIHVSLIEPGPIESEFRTTARVLWDTHIDLDNSPHRENYQDFKSNMAKIKQKSIFTLGPEAVVKRLIHALESPRPKARYYVTFPTYLLSFLRRILPSRWMDRVMVRITKQEMGR